MANLAAETQKPDMNPALKPALSINAALKASCAQGVWMIPGAASNALKFFAAKL
jgi:hypothetical protein|tara:strand:+ start:253 stop:414 length:162 start_codon:yes stop_codon:yes gene_type:complete